MDSPSCARRRGWSRKFAHPRVNNFVAVRDQGFADDFVVPIQGNDAVANQDLEKGRHIGSKHLAGMKRRRRSKIEGAKNGHSLVNESFPGAGKFAIAAALGG